MKVSIVIPVHNSEQYIQKSIDSALQQTYSNTEVIVVDDGSTDNSPNILKEYSKKIKIITKTNGGTGTALNMGIRSMTGDWFKWLGHDDILKKNAVEMMIKEIEKLGKESINYIFYTNYDIIDGNGSFIKEFIEPDYNQKNNFERNTILLDHYYGNVNTSLIHKSIFDRFGLFNEKVGHREDYEFWLRCCLLYNCRLYLISTNTLQYRIHDKQITNQMFEKNLRYSNLVRERILEEISSEQRKKYLIALKKYQKQKPVYIRIRRMTRDIMFEILPESLSNKVLRLYRDYKHV